jgi:hypothetical protein
VASSRRIRTRRRESHLADVLQLFFCFQRFRILGEPLPNTLLAVH